MILRSALFNASQHPQSTVHQVYNALDCCITFEVWEKLQAELAARPNAQAIYRFEMGVLPVLLEMQLRGWRIDIRARDQALANIEKILTKLQSNLDKLAFAMWQKPLNAGSVKQKVEFFYEYLGLPVQYKQDKGERRVTVDREALEKLEAYLYARPVINHIKTIQDFRKLAGTLRTRIDADERLRAAFNIGTDTGRLSSSKNAFGTGTNLQNITPEIRRIFVADPGWKLGGFDFAQIESRLVGAIIYRLFGDRAYLIACESGDLHTSVASMCWPEIKSRADADRIFYRHFTYRDLSKRLGHATNYRGSPWELSKRIHIPQDIVKEFQRLYFRAFPFIQRWHIWVAQQIMTKMSITTMFGRERDFFSRPDDDATIRAAIAYEPQSMAAELTNTALWRIWKFNKVQLLGQLHDAIYWQYPEHIDEVRHFEESTYLATIPFPVSPLDGGSEIEVTIPVDFKYGWNWQEVAGDRPLFIEPGQPYSPNPDGLIKFKGQDVRTRQFHTEVLGPGGSFPGLYPVHSISAPLP